MQRILKSISILRSLVLKDFNDSSSDGYDLVDKYFALFPHIRKRIFQANNNAISKDLVKKYRDGFAIWNLLEILFPVKLLRNGAAHGSCLLNSLKTPYSLKVKPDKPLNDTVTKILGNKNYKTMHNKRIN